jgi:hypothetical protein
MRIPEEIHKSVVFVGCRYWDGTEYVHKPMATAFVASVPEGGASFSYLVTARHWLVKNKSQLPDFDNVQEFRVNMLGGEANTIRHNGQWWFHPTEEKSVDVAVCPFDGTQVDVVPVSANSFLSDDTINDYYIGPGDEVAITGLFSKLTGKSKNIPIVRRGSVAILPEDKIPSVDLGDETPRDIEGYLIEVRSVGGLSGSPAFVRAPIGVDYNVHTRSGEFRQVKAHFQGDYHFLGLCQGHWEIPPDAKNKVEFPIAKRGEDSINLGIAIVVPAKKILEVINHPNLVTKRKAAEQARLEAHATKPPD